MRVQLDGKSLKAAQRSGKSGRNFHINLALIIAIVVSDEGSHVHRCGGEMKRRTFAN